MEGSATLPYARRASLLLVRNIVAAYPARRSIPRRLPRADIATPIFL